jgi:seryl-tRNA synthetase
MRAIAQLRTEASVARQAAEAALAAAGSKSDEDIMTRLDEMSRRLTQLEDRSEQADANLHRLLAMLINWVENDIREKDDYVGTGRAA